MKPPACLAVLAALAAGCSERDSRYCDEVDPCPGGMICDVLHRECVYPDAGQDGDGAVDVGAEGEAGVDVLAPDAAGSCGGDQDCPSAQAAFCVSGVCAGCAGAPIGACAARDSALPVCGGSGACVECGTSADCSAEPAKPICVAGACAACSADPACMSRDSAKPACEIATGRCRACVTSAHCTGAATPVCNTATFTCRACGADLECAGKPENPSICLEGQCPAAIHVKAGGSCSDAGAGTAAAPFCTAQKGVDRLKTSGETRRLVILRGAVTPFALKGPVTASGKVHIAGQETATLNVGAAGAGIDLSDLDIAVRDLFLGGGTNATGAGVRIIKDAATTDVTLQHVTSQGNAGVGVQVTSATIVHLDRCLLISNAQGGLQINQSDFDVTNSIIAGNGTTGAPPTGTPFGGVYLGSTLGATTKRFQNNTVTGNAAATATGISGIFCLSGYTIQASIVYSNDPQPQTFSPLCVVAFTNTDDTTRNTTGGNLAAPPLFKNAGLNDYHLTSSSPCKDALTPAQATSIDYDNLPRPQGASSDCGAYEYVP